MGNYIGLISEYESLEEEREVLFKEYQMLPPELKCHIISQIKNLNDIINIFKATEGNFEERSRVNACIEKIYPNPNNPNEMIPANLVIPLININEIKVPILVNELDELSKLALLPKVFYYDIVLGHNFDQSLTTEGYTEYFNELIYFLDKLILSNKQLYMIEFKMIRINFYPYGTLDQIRYKNGAFLIQQFMLNAGYKQLYGAPSYFDILKYILRNPYVKSTINRVLYDVLEILNEITVLRAIEIPSDLFIFAGYISQEKIEERADFYNTIIKLNNLTEIGLRNVFYDLHLYFDILNDPTSNVNRIYLMKPDFKEFSFMTNKIYRKLSFASIAVINGIIYPNLKNVYIDIPLDRSIISTLIIKYPNIQSIGLYTSNFESHDECNQYINDFFYNHPNIKLLIYVLHPKLFLNNSYYSTGQLEIIKIY